MESTPNIYEFENGSPFLIQRPDFIIGGAMKSGTSTLHQLLATHPSIFIPNKEVAFFDLDDIDLHPDFFIFAKGNWHFIDFDRQFGEISQWYSRQFADAKPGQLVGDDSPGYLASTIAPARIAKYLPNVKLIFLLRNPADRTYSHYWHMLRTGREFYSFEDSLMITPESKMSRGRYQEQLERFMGLFPRDRIYVESFERLVKDQEKLVNEVLDFLGLGPFPVGKSPEKPMHANPAKLPLSLGFRRLENSMFRKLVARLYANGNGPSATPRIFNGRVWNEKLGSRVAKSVFRSMNPQTVRKAPPMKTKTRQFLNAYFKRENRGLAELVGFPLDANWYD